MSAQNTQIDSYHLSVPRLLLEYSNAKRSFGRGALIGAISNSDKRFDVPLELQESLGSQSASVWARRSVEYMTYSEGLESFKIPPRLSIEEADNLFELWKHCGVVNAGLYFSRLLICGSMIGQNQRMNCSSPNTLSPRGILGTSSGKVYSTHCSLRYCMY